MALPADAQPINLPEDAVPVKGPATPLLPQMTDQEKSAHPVLAGIDQTANDVSTLAYKFLNGVSLNNLDGYLGKKNIQPPNFDNTAPANKSGLNLAGDIAGLGGLVKNPINSFLGKSAMAGQIPQTVGAGALSGFLTKPAADNPVDRLMQGAAGGALGGVGAYLPQGITSLKSILNPSTEDMLGQAHKLTTEILQPSKSELANSIERGRVLPAIQQAADVITKSGSYEELNQNLGAATSSIMNERNELLKANNFMVKDDYLKPLQDLIKNTSEGGQATPAELQQMDGVLAREKAYLVTQGGSISRLDAQARKEYLQKQTQNLLTKLSTGDSIDTQPARSLALNAIRGGLKTAVEGDDSKIAELNSTYGGLLRAQQLVAGQYALAQKGVPLPPIERTIRGFTGLFTKPQDTVMQLAMKNSGNLASKTAKIESLMQRVKANRLQQFVPDSPAAEPELLQLPAPAKPLADYLKERQGADIEPLGVKGTQQTASGSKEPIPLRGASVKATTNQTNPAPSANDLMNESYKNAAKAKLRRMIKY